MRNPAGRLGAGGAGTAYDMQALRSHPFFASIRWKTLWSDTAPPLEAGLVKRDRSLALSQEQHWEDMGAAWDDLVGNEEQYLDEISWASDGEGPKQTEVQNGYGNGKANGLLHEIGPMGEVPRYATRALPEKLESCGIPATAVEGPPNPLLTEGTKTLPIPTLVHLRDTSSTRSASSSDGSPIEKLGVALESFVIDRGRDRSLTPVQGNGSSTDVDL